MVKLIIIKIDYEAALVNSHQSNIFDMFDHRFLVFGLLFGRIFVLGYGSLCLHWHYGRIECNQLQIYIVTPLY